LARQISNRIHSPIKKGNKEDNRRIHNPFERTCKNAAPRRLELGDKYLFQYVVDCRNNIPNNHTTPLTPAIIFAGQRASARGLPFGTAAMLRVGKDKRAAFGLLAAKAELGVYLGGLMRQDAGRWLLANGFVVARSDRAIRIRDVSTPFGWKAKDSIAPTRLLDSALKAPGYVYIPGAPNETTLPTTAPSDLDDEFVDDMAPAEPQPVHGSVKRPMQHSSAGTDSASEGGPSAQNGGDHAAGQADPFNASPTRRTPTHS
jgi:hypothetical protein